MENNFELRELKSKDIFPMVKILRKIGFKELKDKLNVDNIKNIMQVFIEQEIPEGQEEEQTNKGEDMASYVGFNIVAEILDVILSNLEYCEQDIYKFLAGLTDMKEKDIAELPMVTFAELIVAVIQKEEFKDFFKVVSKLFDQMN